MFDSVEVGNTVDRKIYKLEVAHLRAELLSAQRDLATSNLAVVISLAGVGGAGKSETVNLLLEWLDARGIQTQAMGELTDEEAQRPLMWRYWRVLPPRGRILILFGNWDTTPILDCVYGKQTLQNLERMGERMVAFERMLDRENVLQVKFWLHLPRRAMKKRLKTLEEDPTQRWRVTRQDWKLYRDYDDYRQISEHLVRRTNIPEAPWNIIESTDARYRNLTVGRTLLRALRDRLDLIGKEPPRPEPHRVVLQPAPRNLINQLNLALRLDPNEYKHKIKKGLAELNELVRQLRDRKRSMILVFEGPDAAGKGGTIRRITSALDARDYRVISVAAPTDEERQHPYLWRFWRHLPGHGRITIYDRSWYGRVLVERIEGFCTEKQWQRAYGEINEFEEQLTDAGIIVQKFWLAISAEEQLRRFKDRQTTPYKQYKITEEDWRNRDCWDSYEAAACEMIEKTSVQKAPWTLVEANDKEWARFKVVKTLIRRLTDALA